MVRPLECQALVATLLVFQAQEVTLLVFQVLEVKTLEFQAQEVTHQASLQQQAFFNRWSSPLAANSEALTTLSGISQIHLKLKPGPARKHSECTWRQ